MGKVKKRSWFTIIRRIFLGLCTLLLCLYIFLHTPYAQDRITDFISEKLSTKDQTVTLNGLGGLWPFHLRLQTGSITDKNGVWVEVQNISLDWKYRKQKIHIQDLNVEELTLFQRPAGEEKTTGPLKPFPELPWEIEVDKIHINRLVLNENFSGKETVLGLTGKLHLSKEGLINTRLSATTSDSTFTLDANYELAEKSFSGKLSEKSRNENRLSITFGSKESGGIFVKGNLQSQDLIERIQFVEPYLQAFNLPPRLVTRYLRKIPQAPLPAKIGLDLDYAQNLLALDTEIQIHEGKVQSHMTYAKDQKKFDLQLQARLPKTQPFGELFGQPIAGQLEGTFSITLQNGLQDLTTDILLTGFSYREFKIEHLQGNLQQQNHGFHIDVNGKDGEREISLTGLFSTSVDGWTFNSDTWTADMPPLSLESEKSFVLMKSGTDFDLQPTSFLLNGIPMALKGNWNSKQIDVSLTLPEIPAAKLPNYEELEIGGTLMGTLQIKGNLDQPDLHMTLACEALEFVYDQFETNTQLDGELNASWSSAGLQLESAFKDTRQNQFSISLHSPESWSLSPFKLPDTHADFSTRLQGTVDLSLLNKFNWLPNQRVSGQLHTHVNFSQTNKKRELKGSVKLTQGKYENFQLGSVLNQIEIAAEILDQKVTLTQADARTPGDGKLSASGHWDLQEVPGSGELSLVINKARVLHLDPVQAALSGKILVSKNAKEKVKVSGKLVLEETTFHMDRLPKPVPKPVPFVVKNGTLPPLQKKKKETSPPRIMGNWVNGDIDIDIPSQLIVEGKNIYSTWEGALKVSLQPSGFYLNGKLLPRRGTVNFFGRAFRLSKGTVHFNDQLGSSPILDLEADYSREDMDAVLLITGRADNPKFNLRSNPPLPEDEILSRILFGKDMATITGLQALEVGLALKSMMDSEGNTDWDLMGKARDFLGVDQLELRESGDAEGSTEIVAGRQINNRLYLEFNQSLKEPGSSLLLEYEIRRNLSITTETGTHTLPGIGVNWKRDY